MKTIISRLCLGPAICVLTILLPALFASTVTQVALAKAAGGPFTRQISSVGTSSFTSATNGTSDPS